MNRKGILFVDDEPNILSGIRRMLRSLRSHFDFYFAESGHEALQLMEENNIQVVVSDMRMPGMDGAEFLTEVQLRHPYAVRIMLTGQADDESVIRAVSVVHQFLTKPCEPERLKEVVLRAAGLHDLMVNEHLKQVVTGIGSLPSIPHIYAKLQEVLKFPDATVDDIAKIIEQDIAMTAKILQLINSSFFGLFTNVESVSRAVKLLGLDTVKILVLGVQIFSELKTDDTIFPMQALWDHSMLVAQCAKRITAETVDDRNMPNNVFIAGMLHDIGRLLLLSKMTDDYVPLVMTARNEDALLLTLEKNAFQSTHSEIGAYLVSLWGFNGEIVEAVGFHDNLSNYPGTSYNAALAVHVADYFYHLHTGDRYIGKLPELNIGYLEKLGFADKIDEWSEICREVITATSR